jgi:hypothetical protein
MRILCDFCDLEMSLLLKCRWHLINFFFQTFFSLHVDLSADVYVICCWSKISCRKNNISRWNQMTSRVVSDHFSELLQSEQLERRQILCFERFLISSLLKISRFFRTICFYNSHYYYNMRNVRRMIDHYQRVTRLFQTRYYSFRNERFEICFDNWCSTIVVFFDQRWI